MPEIKVYTLDEVAQMLKVHRRTLYRWISNKQINAVKLGGYWRITEQALQDFVSGTKR